MSTLQNITGTIALAGAGKMGGAMLAGWLAGGLDAKRVVVIEPMPSAEITALAAKGVRLNPNDIGQVETLVIAVKPQSFREAGAALKVHVTPSTLVVSIMAGTTMKSLQEVCGGAVVRAMPNTPAAIGRGITVAVAAGNVSAAQRATADALLRATGSVEWVEDEGLMDAVTAVSGSGPAYIFLLAEELARAGVVAGLPEELATKLARETVAGSGELLHRSDLSSATLRQNVTSPGVAAGLPEELATKLARETVAGSGELLHRSDLPSATLRQNVTSPGGTTAAALEVLMGKDGMRELMTRAIAAATARSKELAK